MPTKEKMIDIYEILNQLECDDEIDLRLIIKELINHIIEIETNLVYVERDLNEVLYDH